MWMTTVVKLFALIRRWHARRSAIAALAALDDRMLKDIGLHRGAIRRLVDDQLAAQKRSSASHPAAPARSDRRPPSPAAWVESCNT